ncbi:MFS transporter [Burkholderia diffusa]|uniref:MFS transporter n=1 Tax=Burkholderia diffusa TaxID=488732 RepID=A0AAW3PKN1_9BURK|nr:MFS transporter [Burkholderia diffusa]KWF26709.1 MFS transporter [Burkholderia diffusa]KWF31700.1 MFS transporter [Burkholderia diffusa]KWF39480.1 MFS transporter [Burkholderia diffusa]KWF57302.1 MFS transporter [Burkholderia diffusa]
MSTQTAVRPLPWRVFCPLLLSMFAIAVGYGFLLPILPRVLARIAATADPATLSRHTGLLTGTYTLSIFVFSPLWGRFADQRGRRLPILLGLVGFATTLGLFAAVNSLPFLYLERALGGLFASSVAPAVYALVGDYAPSDDWRARRYAMLNIAGATGFLVGPMLGSLTMHIAHADTPRIGEPLACWPPFVMASALAFSVSLAVLALVPRTRCHERDLRTAQGQPQGRRAVLVRLLAISSVTAAAVGAFEVGLSLRGTQTLGMSISGIGLMFTECSLIMLAVQSVVFSPLVKPDLTRWFLTPALIVLAVGLAAVPLVAGNLGTAITVAVVASSAGIISPIATYWISLGAGERQGAALGWQTSAASLGQAAGSAGGGLLFGLTVIPNASFTLTAAAVLAGLIASVRLPCLLAHAGFSNSTKQGNESLTDGGLADASSVKIEREIE